MDFLNVLGVYAPQAFVDFFEVSHFLADERGELLLEKLDALCEGIDGFGEDALIDREVLCNRDELFEILGEVAQVFIGGEIVFMHSGFERG